MDKKTIEGVTVGRGAAYERFDDEAAHRELARLNERRLSPTLGEAGWRDALAEETRLRLREDTFVEEERAGAAARAAEAPTEPSAFVAWFESLRDWGPGQGDLLFPWLEHHATLSDVRWFLAQEVAGEAGFEDLVALTQLRMPVVPKLELARNYWDELGRGQASGMHGPMLARLADELLPASRAEPVWEAQALSNLLVALSINRRYAFHAVGALGVIELTAPGRATHVNAALKRLGVAAHTRQYFALHATLDVQHSASWNREVLIPLVAEDPRRARGIAEGALMRLQAGARCFERYRRELGVKDA